MLLVGQISKRYSAKNTPIYVILVTFKGFGKQQTEFDNRIGLHRKAH